MYHFSIEKFLSWVLPLLNLLFWQKVCLGLIESRNDSLRIQNLETLTDLKFIYLNILHISLHIWIALLLLHFSSTGIDLRLCLSALCLLGLSLLGLFGLLFSLLPPLVLFDHGLDDAVDDFVVVRSIRRGLLLLLRVATRSVRLKFLNN